MSKFKAASPASQAGASKERTETASHFIKAPDAVFDSRLSKGDILVLLALADHAWGNKTSCYPSLARIAARTKLTERSVRYSLRRLEQFGIIATIPNPSRKTGREYLLRWMDTPGDAPPTEAQPAAAPSKRKRRAQEIAPEAAVPKIAPEERGAKSRTAGVREIAPESDNPPLGDEKYKTPSSSSDKRETDDDDPQGSIDLGEDPEGLTEVLEAVRECFGDDLADVVRRDSARIGKQIGGRWDCYLAATIMAGKRQNRPDNPLAWIRKTAAKDYAANGISAEAEAAVEKWRREKGKRAEAERQFKAERARKKAAEAERQAEEAAEVVRLAKMSPEELLAEVERQEWTLTVNGQGGLEPRHARGNQIGLFPPALKQRLIDHKPAIIGLLRSRAESEPPETAVVPSKPDVEREAAPAKARPEGRTKGQSEFANELGRQALTSAFMQLPEAERVAMLERHLDGFNLVAFEESVAMLRSPAAPTANGRENPTRGADVVSQAASPPTDPRPPRGVGKETDSRPRRKPPRTSARNSGVPPAARASA